MKRSSSIAIGVILLTALFSAACGNAALQPAMTPMLPSPTTAPTATPLPTSTPISPTPTPEIMEPNYTEPAWGLSLWYPTHWISDVQAEGLIFATSAELIEGSEFSAGAAMGVLSAELQTGQTVDEFLQMMLEELYFEDMATSDQQGRTIGGQPGLVVTLEGTPERGEYPLRGFMAVAQRGGWGYLFVGVSAAHEWSEYGSTLEEMLRSVRFEEIEHIYSSDAMGLTTWYPEDWTYEEDSDQVIFASSEDLLRSGNLEKGAAMLVSTSSLREASLEEWFEDQATELDFESGGPTSRVKPRTVGGQTGLTFRLEGIPTGSETLVKGFMAATEFEDWGYFFLGVSVAEEWAEYGPMLEEMLDSVQFME